MTNLHEGGSGTNAKAGSRRGAGERETKTTRPKYYQKGQNQIQNQILPYTCITTPQDPEPTMTF